MALTFNGNAPSTVTYNGQAVTVEVTYNGVSIWKAVSLSSPSNLRVNGLTIATASSCNLTWPAATLTGATGIPHRLYKNGSLVATTTDTTYTFSVSEIES